MRRREFIAGLGGVAMWPLAARAQQRTPVIGFLSGASAATFHEERAALQRGLSETGYTEGQNVAVEYRWADNQQDRLPGLAAELVAKPVDVIATFGGTLSSLAAKAATKSIPIVFVTGDDPVRLGLVASLNRPGGNVTGVTFITTSLETKRLEILRELVPKAAVIGLLVNPTFPDAEVHMKELPSVARRIGQQAVVVAATNEPEIDAAFATLVQRRASALLVTSDPFFGRRREQLAALAARHKIPAIYWRREFVTSGGLISYGASFTDAYRQTGVYVGRILHGARPDDLPVMQPTRFELIINLRTAKALGLAVPPSLLARADEVIE
jgi:putative ABC transport system substrate-binding protein